MATIEQRGPFQFRVKIRRAGRTSTRTFEGLAEAQKWARIEEGRISGDEYIDRRVSRTTSLAEAIELYEREGMDGSRPHAKNIRSKLKYWREMEYARWSIVKLRPSDLLVWRRAVLDEDAAEDGELRGPNAECSAQTVVHRLNTLSQVYKHWRLHRDPLVENPVIEGVRPPLQNARDRRLLAGEDGKLLKAVAGSSRPWLKAAVIISLESAMRQAELAGLVWGRVHLDGRHPHAFLPHTKNGRARKVPLSRRAVEAFNSLKPRDVEAGDPVFPVETPRAFGHAWRNVVTDENFPDLRWHDLRHEATSRLFENTDLRDVEIMAITGHLRPEMLKRYAHLRTHRLAPKLNAPRKPTRRAASRRSRP